MNLFETKFCYKLVQYTANMFTTNLINLLTKSQLFLPRRSTFQWMDSIRSVVNSFDLHYSSFWLCFGLYSVMHKHHPIHRQIYHGISFVRKFNDMMIIFCTNSISFAHDQVCNVKAQEVCVHSSNKQNPMYNDPLIPLWCRKKTSFAWMGKAKKDKKQKTDYFA